MDLLVLVLVLVLIEDRPSSMQNIAGVLEPGPFTIRLIYRLK